MPVGIYIRTEEIKKKFKGNKNAWKGGINHNGDGYVLRYTPYHPYCDKKGYVYIHRLIVEKYIKRHLKPTEECHHINKIKDDNKLKNLMAFINHKIHMRFERKLKINPNEIIFDGRKI